MINDNKRLELVEMSGIFLLKFRGRSNKSKPNKSDNIRNKLRVYITNV